MTLFFLISYIYVTGIFSEDLTQTAFGAVCLKSVIYVNQCYYACLIIDMYVLLCKQFSGRLNSKTFQLDPLNVQ